MQRRQRQHTSRKGRTELNSRHRDGREAEYDFGADNGAAIVLAVISPRAILPAVLAVSSIPPAHGVHASESSHAAHTRHAVHAITLLAIELAGVGADEASLRRVGADKPALIASNADLLGLLERIVLPKGVHAAVGAISAGRAKSSAGAHPAARAAESATRAAHSAARAAHSATRAAHSAAHAASGGAASEHSLSPEQARRCEDANH